LRYADAGGEEIDYEIYENQKRELHWDIVWQIFDEVNKDNDTFCIVNLNCL
jgi:hypothetical protein